MKTVLSFFAVILFSANGFTQNTSSAEVMCRSQAKEIAMQTYSGCMTEARNNQVEEIRKNYQKELTDLKAKYDQELKKMGAGSAATTGAKKTAKSGKTAKTNAAKPVKGIAKELPNKTASSGETMSVQNVPEGTKVVTAAPETASNTTVDPIETEAARADQVEIVEVPAE